MITIALTTVWLATAGLQATDIKFAPAEGLRLSKTALLHHEMSLDAMGTTREGGALQREDNGGWLAAGARVSLEDEYLQVSGGRPTLFRRTLKSMEGNARMTLTGGRAALEHTARFESPLAGFAVMHTWIPAEGVWGRCYDYLTSDEEELANLDDDTDLLGFLPPGPVEAGATWPVDPAALRRFLAPGGNTGAEPSEDGYFARMVEVGIGGDMADVLGEELVGSVSATFQEVREVEGRLLAVIAVEFNVFSERDRTRTYLIGMPKEEKRESSSLRQVIVTWIGDGTAEILWDLEDGHAYGATLAAHETVTAEVFKTSTAETGVPFDFSQRTTYSGQLDAELKFRARGAGEEDEPAGAQAAGGSKGKKKRKKKNR